MTGLNIATYFFRMAHKLLLKFFILAAPIYIVACKSSKQGRTKEPTVYLDSLKELIVNGADPVYRASETRVNDIVHTRLEVSFNWKNQTLNGIATLDVKPYFKPTNILELDAKYMNIQEVSLKSSGKSTPLTYTYDSLKLKITLDKTYDRNNTYSVQIRYVAQPEKVKQGGSEAITSDKGLYFINPLGTEEGKPTQLWTQGETEASSCWFPTIDKPNERMTQEIYITVDTSFVTLSNGVLVFQKDNPDGTRTDCWKQSLPAAPYLTMMAVGKWNVVKDSWRDLEVNYYMEPAFTPLTKRIFGKTPKMLEFYSQRMGVDYPWEKYSQVIVRDYVSGAMENTTAVIHGDFFNQTEREMLDGDNESTIAHELFHHWFGDLVTCESWSNLPLNESFATYGEYLWLEYEDGRYEADFHGYQDLRKYLAESSQKKEDLIRFYYNDKEDMFDMHSYAKGGRILHMLRKYLGDEVFFEGLKVYLNDNKFQSVEIHNLRLAFEKVSGEDLNWFFNQWFLAKGHPVLELNSEYDSLHKKVSIAYAQKQDLKEVPLYKLPVDVELYFTNGRREKQRVWLTKSKEIIQLDVTEKPLFVNIDAEKQILCQKSESKTKEEWLHQLQLAPLFLDKFEAINQLSVYAKEKNVAEALSSMISHPHHAIRAAAIRNLNPAAFDNQVDLKNILLQLALKDPKSSVRGLAIRKLGDFFADSSTVEVVKGIAMNDQSYLVEGEALNAVNNMSPKEGLQLARSLAKDASGELVLSVALILVEKGDVSDLPFFQKNLSSIGDQNAKYAFTGLSGSFTGNLNAADIETMLPVFDKIARKESAWYMRLAGIQALSEIAQKVDARIQKAESEKNVALALQLNQVKGKVNDLLADIRKQEKDEKVKRIIGN